MIFLDEAVISVRGGNGGDGCMSFRREKYVPKGGPDGGNGGVGGSVILVADSHKSTLMDFRYRRSYRAGDGGHGRGKRQHGKKGEELRIPVPLGTLVRDESAGEVIADLVEDGAEVVVAMGGRGGRGNACFARPTNQAPTRVESGCPGEEKTISLELKLIADVGLVGLPNAGKSTLLSRISAARPKIAEYPFTTLRPVLGVVEANDGNFVVADIPGIIEGAHRGKGMGLSFLRHIERTLLIAVLIDVTSGDPVRDCRQIREELRAYSHDLWSRPYCIVLTKCDLMPPGAGMPDIDQGDAFRVFLVSAVSGTGINELVGSLSMKVEELRHGLEEESDGR